MAQMAPQFRMLAPDLLPLLAGALPNSRLQVLPGLGHMAPVLNTDRVNPLIAEFLSAPH